MQTKTANARKSTRIAQLLTHLLLFASIGVYSRLYCSRQRFGSKKVLASDPVRGLPFRRLDTFLRRAQRGQKVCKRTGRDVVDALFLRTIDTQIDPAQPVSDNLG